MSWTSFSKTSTILDFAVLATVPSVAVIDHRAKLVLQNILCIKFACLGNDSQSRKNISICCQNFFFQCYHDRSFHACIFEIFKPLLGKASYNPTSMVTILLLIKSLAAVSPMSLAHNNPGQYHRPQSTPKINRQILIHLRMDCTTL